MIRPFLFIDNQKRKLSAIPYINQRTHPTCIYNVYEYFTTKENLEIIRNKTQINQNAFNHTHKTN
jgi:hypothetical protein